MSLSCPGITVNSIPDTHAALHRACMATKPMVGDMVEVGALDFRTRRDVSYDCPSPGTRLGASLPNLTSSSDRTWMSFTKDPRDSWIWRSTMLSPEATLARKNILVAPWGDWEGWLVLCQLKRSLSRLRGGNLNRDDASIRQGYRLDCRPFS